MRSTHQTEMGTAPWSSEAQCNHKSSGARFLDACFLLQTASIMAKLVCVEDLPFQQVHPSMCKQDVMLMTLMLLSPSNLVATMYASLHVLSTS